MAGTATKTQPQNDGSHVHGLPDGEIRHDKLGVLQKRLGFLTTMRRLFVLGPRIFTVIIIIDYGQFTESRKGKHTYQFILDDEELRQKAAQWVRANSTVIGRPNMTGANFSAYVNTHLLPEAKLAPGCPSQIQPHTAMKWFHHIGFRPQSHKKSIYIDGHERYDMVEYRKLYLRKLEILSKMHLPPPACEDGMMTFQTGDPAAKHLVMIFHDKSSFHANEGQSFMWAVEGRVLIRPKSQGRGLMVGDFVTEFDGLLQLAIVNYTPSYVHAKCLFFL